MTQNNQLYTKQTILYHTLHPVLIKLQLIQELNLLSLQTITKNKRDIHIYHPTHEKELTKIISRYTHDFDDVMKYKDVISIFNLKRNSSLRKGLERQIPF